MCGRYALYGPVSRYREHFDARDADFEFPPRFNVAPSLEMPVVRQDKEGARHFVLARWGLIPHWCKDPKTIQRPINAKAETAALKPMFRDAFRRSRVLVPAEVFYEWKPAAGGKKPFAIGMRDGSPFAMAGLLDRWRGPDGELLTFAILTTEANPLVAEIHNRMPAIIAPEQYGRWLDPDLSDVVELQKLLAPFPERFMRVFPVGKAVSNPANDGPELIVPVDEPSAA